jgi:hypothetical protein
MRFDGINDYIEVGTPVIVTDLPRKTVVLRLSLAAFNAAGPARLVEKRDPNTGWTFAANNTNIPSGLSFTQDFSTTSGQWGLSNAITTNTCYTLGFTYDNTSTSNQPTFFIDGVAFAPTDVITGPPAGTASSDATSSLKLGDQGDGTRAFSGVMLDVRIYNRILDAREMRDLHLAYTERDGYARLFLAPLESLSYVQPAGAGPVLRRRAPHTYQ